LDFLQKVIFMISFDITKNVIEFLSEEERGAVIKKRVESQIRVGSIEEAFKTISLLDIDDPSRAELYQKIGLAVHNRIYSTTSDTAFATFSKIKILPQNAMRHICVTDFFSHIYRFNQTLALTIPNELDPLKDRVSLGAIAIQLARDGNHERAVEIALSILRDPYLQRWGLKFDRDYYLLEIARNYLKDESISFDKIANTLSLIENSPSRDGVLLDFVRVLLRANRVDEAISWASQISDTYYKEDAKKLLESYKLLG